MNPYSVFFFLCQSDASCLPQAQRKLFNTEEEGTGPKEPIAIRGQKVKHTVAISKGRVKKTKQKKKIVKDELEGMGAGLPSR